jgi:hypothetical protein
MDTLPKFLPVFDASWKPSGEGARWKRVEAKDDSLLEEHINALVCSNVGAIADSMQGAGIMEEETALIVLGTRVDSIDVVLAEVDADGEAFRRLVLVETKLLHNPQARRSVLARVVEYGHVAQRTWPGASLPNLFNKADRAWLDRNAADIDESLRRGEYLLLVVGDRIDKNITAVARRFAAQENPVNLSELAVVSLALFRRGPERLVVPHVVSAVTLGERTMTIQVRVEDMSSRRIPATVMTRSDLPLRSKEEGAPVGAREFLVKLGRILDPEMVAEEWSVTKRPRKQLSYGAEYNDADVPGGAGTRVMCVIHFGGYVPEWRPLLIGLDVTATSTVDRDALQKRFEERVAAGVLPPRAAVTVNGPVTIRALAPIDWAHASDLNDALAARVVSVFRKMRDELVPIVSGTGG